MSKKLDFLKFKTKKDKNGIVTEVYPDFNMRYHKDIMVRSGKFYAIWNEDKKVWEEDEIAVVDIIDRELDEYVKAHPEYANASVKSMEDAGSGAMDHIESMLRSSSETTIHHGLTCLYSFLIKNRKRKIIFQRNYVFL